MGPLRCPHCCAVGHPDGVRVSRPRLRGSRRYEVPPRHGYPTSARELVSRSSASVVGQLLTKLTIAECPCPKRTVRGCPGTLYYVSHHEASWSGQYMAQSKSFCKDTALWCNVNKVIRVRMYQSTSSTYLQWPDTSLRTPSYIIYLGLVRRINTSSLAAVTVTLILSHYLRR